jgi:hypothetical protein
MVGRRRVQEGQLRRIEKRREEKNEEKNEET